MNMRTGLSLMLSSMSALACDQSVTEPAVPATEFRANATGSDAKIVWTARPVQGEGHDLFIMNDDGTGLLQLTTHSSDDFEPVLSPDGSQVAFVSFRSGAGDIYVTNADGSGVPTRVTTHPAFERHPTWRPDGTMLAYSSLRTGMSEIYEIRSVGGLPKQLTFTSNSSNPDWSPDGRFLAMVRPDAFETSIFVMHLATGKVVKITSNAHRDGDPAWSPNGKFIAYTTDEFGGDWDIAKVRCCVSGSAMRVQLTTDPAGDMSPAWSPDGSRIAFTTQRGSAGFGDLYVMQADGTMQLPLPNNHGSGLPDIQPHWR